MIESLLQMMTQKMPKVPRHRPLKKKKPTRKLKRLMLKEISRRKMRRRPPKMLLLDPLMRKRLIRLRLMKLLRMLQLMEQHLRTKLTMHRILLGLLSRRIKPTCQNLQRIPPILPISVRLLEGEKLKLKKSEMRR